MTRSGDSTAEGREEHALDPAWMAGEAERDEARVIENPISGERIVIRRSGTQTDGRLLAFDLFLPPGGHVPAQHTHPVQEERFTIVAGVMRFQMRGRTIMASPGETVAVPPGTPHWFGNAGSGVSQARVEVRPALRMEELFVSSAALGRLAHQAGMRLPWLTGLARFLLDFEPEVGVPHVPAAVLRMALVPVAWLGRRRGASDAPGHAA